MSTQNGKNEANSQRSVILVGVDFSSLSNEALHAAADLARSSKSELHVVHVMPLSNGDPLSISPANEGLALATRVDEIRSSLRATTDPVINGIERVCLHMRVGAADRAITQLASDLQADLIVVGTNGRTGLDRLLLGSVAESVVRHAPCPVYAFRPKTLPVWDQIEPPCPDCVTTQKESAGAKLWCAQHSQHHPKAHTYYESPQGYGLGAQTFLELS